ncbi:MAG TPA: hypothetical protein PKI01_06740 [Bacteroidales bacterium]|nr:hypothetical protein [Bacteroidales bacterium]
MKRFYLLLVLLFLTGFSYGQIKKSVEIPVNNNGDTTQLYKWITDIQVKLKMNRLRYSSDPVHFRFWQDGQAIDIWSVDNKTLHGQVTNYVWENKTTIWKKKKLKPGKLYSNQYALDGLQARTVYNLFLRDSIKNISSEEKNSGWSQGSEGNAYCFEISTPGSYTFKTFWAPTSLGNLKDATPIEEFVKNINTTANLQQFLAKFYDSLPGGSYTNGGAKTIVIPEKIFTDYYYDYDYDYEYDDYYLDY